jgi:hypothetical protein
MPGRGTTAGIRRTIVVEKPQEGESKIVVRSRDEVSQAVTYQVGESLFVATPTAIGFRMHRSKQTARGSYSPLRYSSTRSVVQVAIPLPKKS